MHGVPQCGESSVLWVEQMEEDLKALHPNGSNNIYLLFSKDDIFVDEGALSWIDSLVEDSPQHSRYQVVWGDWYCIHYFIYQLWHIYHSQFSHRSLKEQPRLNPHLHRRQTNRQRRKYWGQYLCQNRSQFESLLEIGVLWRWIVRWYGIWCLGDMI